MENLDSYKNVPVSVAAEMLGVSQPSIREAIKDGRLPIGYAIQITGEKWSFHISPGLLKEYITGSIALKKYFEENKEILKEILEDTKKDCQET